MATQLKEGRFFIVDKTFVIFLLFLILVVVAIFLFIRTPDVYVCDQPKDTDKFISKSESVEVTCVKVDRLN